MQLHAIKLALGVARRTRKDQYVIFSDSMSALQAISHFDLNNQLVLEIITEYTCLIKMGKQIVFCWFPSHVGIPRNEKTDLAAKCGLNKPITNIVPPTDFNPAINELCKSQWQQS